CGRFAQVRAVTRAGGDAAKRARVAALRDLGADVAEYAAASEAAFARAFAGIDTVVSAVGLGGVGAQVAMADGALQAGVRWFLPSEFGLPGYASAWLPFAGPLAPKAAVRRHLAACGLPHTVVYTGLALDYLDPRALGLKLRRRAATLVGRGGAPASFTALHDVVRLIVAVVLRPHDMRARVVRYAASTAIMRDLVKLAADGDRGDRVKIVCIADAKRKFAELARRQDCAAFQIYTRLLIEEGLARVDRAGDSLDNACFPELHPESVHDTLRRLIKLAAAPDPPAAPDPAPPRLPVAHRADTYASVTDGLGRTQRTPAPPPDPEKRLASAAP
ncbi:hypothetical protein IWW55_007314, partial [Coemansia sp. RSA 2706]